MGSADVAFSNANVTLTLTDTNASQTARNMRLNLTGTATAGYNLIVPAIEKPYIINNGTDGTITVKNATGTGIAVPAGKTMWVYNDGTNVVDAVTRLSSLTLGTALAVGSGGTGANTLTSNGVLLGNGTSAISATAAGTTGQVLVGNTGGAPTWATLSTSAVTSFSAGTTGFTPNTATTGAVTLAGTLNVANGGTGATSLTSGYLVKGNGTSAASASVVYDNGTNVGIGTSSPGVTLDVNGTARMQTSLLVYGSGDRLNIFPQAAGSGVQLLTTNNTNTAYAPMTLDGTPTIFNYAGAELMRLTGTGLGIGTSSPSGRLDVVATSAGGTTYSYFQNNGASGVSSAGLAFAQSGSIKSSIVAAVYGNDYMTFNVGSNTERMRIDSNGYLGIATTSPQRPLHVAYLSSNVGAYTAIFQGQTGGYGAGVSFQSQLTGGSLAEMGRITADGESSWNTTASTQYAGLRFYTSTAGTVSEKMRLNGDGKLLVGATTGVGALTVESSTATAAVFRNPSASGYTSLRLYNDQNSGSRALEIDYFGSTASGGERAEIATTGAYPLLFLTNNSERMRIDSSGNVGIGTTSVPYKFTVRNSGAEGLEVGPGYSSGFVLLQAYNRALTAYAVLDASASYFRWLVSGTEKMRIDSSGNLGIGTSSPSQKLTVQGAQLTIPAAGWSSGQVAYNYLGDTNGGIRATNGGNVGVFAYNGFDVTVNGVTPVTAMTVTSGANVGIGTASPSTKLEVAGNIRIASGGDLNISSATGGNDSTLYNDAQDLFFSVNGATRMYVNSSGDVGIGTTGNASRLDVRKAAGATAIVSSYNQSTTGNVYGYYSDLQSTGNSTSSYHYAGVTQGVNVWYLYGNGTSSWSSDQRLKKNIETTRDGYLEDLCKLRVVKYNWHTDAEDKPRELGLIAQEVEEVFPGLVEDALHTLDGTKTKYKVLKGSVLPFMLLKALQEANTKIDELTARVAQLEGK